MFQKMFLLTTICFLSNFSQAAVLSSSSQYFTDVSCSVTDPDLCASGGMQFTSAGIYPVLTMSTDGGKTWLDQINASSTAADLPANFGSNPVLNSTALVTSVSCSGSVTDGFCIGAGYYEVDSSLPLYPMVAVVTTAGAISYPIDRTLGSLPAGFQAYNQVQTNGGTASCSSTECMIVGSYQYASGMSPMVATITPSGATYTVEYNQGVPADFVRSSGYLNAIDCNETTCVIAGNYIPQGNISYPMLASSTDSGWNYIINSGGPIPSDRGPGTIQFNTVSCNSNNVCVAAGYYIKSNNIYPMIATGRINLANSWQYTLTSTSSLPAGYVNSGVLTSSSCSTTACVVAGNYNFNGTPYNMALNSTDNGQTWNYSVDSSKGLPAEYSAMASDLDVDCTADNCVIASGYQYTDAQNTPNTYFPWLATSTNGSTWTSVVDVDNPLTPTTYVAGNPGIFLGVYCGTACLATGAYYDSNMNINSMLIQSGRLTWNYVIE